MTRGTGAGARMPGTGPSVRPWTVRLGLALLWSTYLVLAALAALLALWSFATLGEPGARVGPVEVLSGLAAIVPLLAMPVVLVLAGRRRRWARWGAVAFRLAAGLLGVVSLIGSGSVAAQTLALTGAGIAGAVLIALPRSGRWYATRPARVQVPAGRPD